MLRLVAVLGFMALADASPPRPDASYDQVKAAAGRDADAQVKLALWCEAHGLEKERLKHLAIAVLADPSNAMARGLLGSVEYGGKWRKPEAVADAMRADVKHADLMAEYNGRRVRTPVKPDAQWKLALWCEEKGLKDESRAHLATVVRLDPTHAEAWKRLGYRKVGNRWVTEARAAAEKTEKQLQQEADKKWRSRLERLRSGLDAKGRRKEEALSELATITDPRAVPAVWSAFVARGGKHQVEAVQVLGQIDAVEASRALAALALSSDNGDVRRLAIQTLRRRDPREWADRLIAMFRDRVKYEIRRVGGPGSPGSLIVGGREFNVNRLYAPPPAPTFMLGANDTIGTDDFGLPTIVRHNFDTITTEIPIAPGQSPAAALANSSGNPRAALAGNPLVNMPSLRPYVERASADLGAGIMGQLPAAERGYYAPNRNISGPTGITQTQDIDRPTVIPVGQMMVQAQRAAIAAEQQLERDAKQIDAWNAAVDAANSRIAGVLIAATGSDLPAEKKAWTSWWGNQLGVAYRMTDETPVPTVMESVPLDYVPQPVMPVSVGVIPLGSPTIQLHHSCFGEGTPVRTLEGPRPIEAIRVGDLVLTQDLATGRLGYRPVVVAFHNPPSPTFKVSLGGAPIVTSPSHRFWVAGRGWVMARDLNVGDPIRTLGSVARVARIEEGEVQPVFNLNVDGDPDFFVGEAAALVHDNTLPDLKQRPFDAPQAVAAK